MNEKYVVYYTASNTVKGVFDSKEEARTFLIQYGGDLAFVSNWCGFCRGECKGEHYVSPATEGY